MARRPFSALFLTLVACAGEKVGDDTGIPGDATVDADGDGFDSEADCDDADGAVNPDADEVCDGVDNDCDGEIDEADATDAATFYEDGDGDGVGAAALRACAAPAGAVEVGGDCDDADAETFPGAAERCDGLDNDCDGEVDEEVQGTWYADTDEDGYGDADSTLVSCDPPGGFVADATDCDDSNAAAFPGNPEVCDEADNDCDGTVDEGVTSTFFQDADGDGYGVADTTTEACATPEGYAAQAGDCDDAETAVSPVATEVCDGVDNDCDGFTDEDDAADAATFYADADGDGFGDEATTTAACAAPSGYVAVGPGVAFDCDDTDAATWPGGDEVCGGGDEDCDGTIDEDDAVDAATWYLDADADGYGGTSLTATSCTQPTGFVADNTDCDDLEPARHPGNPEVCDTLDNDCDGSVDEGVGVTWYADADGDGFGDAAVVSADCTRPTGYVADATDCDDASAATWPGASESCDGADNDCDGSTDEGVMGTGAACAVESCLDVLLDDASASDGSYWLDPTGSGTPTPWACDMTTDGGGWTRIVEWDRTTGTDSVSTFRAKFTQELDNMTRFRDQTGYIEWADYNSTADVMAYRVDVDVPNGGELLYDLKYTGNSMEQSGTWFFVESGGTDQNLLCWEDLTTSAFNATERSYIPGYACVSTGSKTWTWNTVDLATYAAPVDAVHLHSMMYDSYGDKSYLYWVAFWVR